MDLSTLGNIALLSCLVTCLASIVFAILGAYRRQDDLIRASINATEVTALAAAFCSSVLVYAFVTDDFSIQYVQHTSDSAMPLFYKITAFWGSLDGSLLFWILILSVFSAFAVRGHQHRHRALIPHVVWILGTINLFFIGVVVFLKNPFSPFVLGAPTTGEGLNPLLQNIYMVVHPPTLYLGYISLSIPFAFGLAAVISRQVDATWQASVRRWTLFSWTLLTIGLVLGGLWAYEELGWGGYWAWDPVENAGLLPWFTTTAFLHSVMIQERRGMLKRWNVSLVIISFWLSIVGTFLTRSGVVQSVHAFGEDPQLAWTFGIFLIFIFVGSFGLLFSRWRLLRSRAELESLLSREAAFLFNNWILLTMAFFVLGSTLWPTFTEWFGDRVTIRPSHFDHYMTPIGLILLMLMGVGPLLAWKRTSKESLQRQFVWPTGIGMLFTIAVILLRIQQIEAEALDAKSLSQQLYDEKFALVCFGLCAFTLVTIVQEFARGLKAARSGPESRDLIDASIRLFMMARRRYGGYIIHLGVVLMFFGFAGKAYTIEKHVAMRPGDTVVLGDYELKHAGLRATEDWQKEMITATVEVYHSDTLQRELTPARWWYFQTPEQPTTEVSRYMTAGADVYASMQTVNLSTGWTQFKFFLNPLVNWVWFGTAIMLMGSLICIGTGKKSKKLTSQRQEGK